MDATIRNTSKTRALGHPTAPANARSVAIAADRTEGDIMIEMVGEDSGKSEGRAARAGDGRVEREIVNGGGTGLVGGKEEDFFCGASWFLHQEKVVRV